MALPIIVIFISVFALFATSVIWLQCSVQRTLRRQLQVLSESACPSCGRLYGVAAAERASQEYSARCQEAQRQHPDWRINFVRYWEVRCPECGVEAEFHYQTESLVAHASKQKLGM